MVVLGAFLTASLSRCQRGGSSPSAVVGTRSYLRYPVELARRHHYQSLFADRYLGRGRWHYHRYHCGQVGRVVAITKLSDVSDLLGQTRHHPQKCFPAILKLASSKDWKEREVAATLLVEASKKTPDDVVAEMTRWADHSNPNVRRTASEGLRDVARKQPELVLAVIAKLKADPNLYVKKSVANVLRNAGNYHPEFVLKVCADWAKENNPDTAWIIKDALRKLRVSHSQQVAKIVK
jgi:3-methyladenine DNA glycosylase AlkC